MHSPLVRVAAYFGSYVLWTLGFHLVTLTLITYAMMDARFQDISEIQGANEITMVAVGSLLYIIILRALNPLTSTSGREIFTAHRFERRFAPGFLQGSALAFGIVVAFLLSGLYRYLGFVIRFEEAPLALVNILLRITALGAMAYCEEFVFRYKILGALRQKISDPQAILVTALAYGVVKAIQFDLGLMQTTTLFLLSLSLGLRSFTDGDFVRGAGFWAGVLIVIHPLLSLPIFGSDFPGVLLIKYEESTEASEAFRMLTGGVGGPLSSFAVQALFLLDVIQGILKNKSIIPTVSKRRTN